MYLFTLLVALVKHTLCCVPLLASDCAALQLALRWLSRTVATVSCCRPCCSLLGLWRSVSHGAVPCVVLWVEYSVVFCGTYSRVPSGIPQVYEAHDGVCDEWTADIEFRDFEHARFKPKPLDDEVRSDCVPTDVGRPIVVEGRLCDTAVQYSRVPCP